MKTWVGVDEGLEHPLVDVIRALRRRVRGRDWKHSRRSWRRGYTGSRRFDRSCRNHGSCLHCQRNRTIASLRADGRAAVPDDGWDGRGPSRVLHLRW